MPRLKARFPQVLQSIHNCAHHAKDATHSLQALAYLDCPELAFKRARLSLKPLYTLSRVRLIQVLRVWLKQEAIQALSAKHFDLLLVFRAQAPWWREYALAWTYQKLEENFSEPRCSSMVA